MSHRKNQTIWQDEFLIRAYEAGANGRLRPEVLCDYLQEAAARHADALELSARHLSGQGLTWILARLLVDFEPLPTWPDAVRVETWPSGIQGIFATRDFVVSSATTERILARATTAWFLIDVQRRRPARLPAAVTDLRLPDRPRALVDDFARLPAVRAGRTLERTAGRSECDPNGHVNHVRYLAWVLDALDPEWADGHTLRRLHALFRSEVLSGSRVEIAWMEGEDGTSRLHEVRSEEGGVIAQARTDWLPRVR